MSERPDPALIAEIQKAASLAGLAHVYPPELYPYPDAAVLQRWIESDDLIFVDEQERGFVAVKDEWLDGLYVRPEAWGSGVAAALHDRAIEAIRAAGHERARLWVLEENVRARRFYERRGWALDGTTRVVEFPPNPLDLGYSLDL